jgi:CheY-like chemotaxis protein
MTKKSILDVGNCGPDFASITHLFHRFDCQVEQAHDKEDALAALGSGEYALVTINRKLDRDYSDGIEIIRAIKANPELAQVPVMLITNFPEHQDAAEALGALRGFGKLEFENSETIARLKVLLDPSNTATIPRSLP